MSRFRMTKVGHESSAMKNGDKIEVTKTVPSITNNPSDDIKKGMIGEIVEVLEDRVRVRWKDSYYCATWVGLGVIKLIEDN